MSLPGFEGVGRVLVIAGIALVGVGLLISYGPNLGLGRLPGDILIKRGNSTFYFPLATSLLLSLILSIVLSLLRRN